MIAHLRTVGFKGFDIDEDIPCKVIYSGPNMSGKSARAGIIALTLLSHIPWDNTGKDINKIVDSYSDGEEFTTFVTIGGVEFGKKFVKGKKKPLFQLDKKRVSEENFTIALGKSGYPKIVNSAEFMKQSEAKKIDALFDLFPNPELSNIDDEIERAKNAVSHWQKKRDDAEATVKHLTNSKQAIKLPAGSIAEIQFKIGEIEAQISDIENQIKQAEIAEAQEKARIEGIQQEKERSEREALKVAENKAPDLIDDIPLRSDEDWKAAGIDSMPSSPEMQKTGQLISDMENSLIIPLKTPSATEDIESSIEKIIDALQQTGCNTCAALIVAKQELKKYGGNDETIYDL